MANLKYIKLLSGTGNSKAHCRTLPHVNGFRRFKMVDLKPEVRVSKLVDVVESNFCNTTILTI